MAYGYASGTNTFTPNNEATGNLLVGYGRNVDKFPLNRYMQLIPVKKRVGYYMRWKSEQASRIRYSDGRDFIWADGADAPSGVDNLEAFENEKFGTTRYLHPFTIGQQAIDQADWPILALHANMTGQQCMTLRTYQAQIALQNAAWGLNQANVDGVAGTLGGNAALLASGQNWTNGSDGLGTNNQPNIKASLNKASIQILKSTQGVIQPKDMALVINPETARRMAESPEINAYVKSSQFSLGQLRGDEYQQNGQWGLPPVLYNHPVIVEDTVVNSARKGTAAASFGFVIPDGEAFLVSRPGKLEGAEGTPAFSTLTGFFYEEMTVESKFDPDNRRTSGRVVSDYQIVVTSPLGGYRMERCLG